MSTREQAPQSPSPSGRGNRRLRLGSSDSGEESPRHRRSVGFGAVGGRGGLNLMRGGGAATSAGSVQAGTHWCHECGRAVNLHAETGLCQNCGGGFVEEGTMILQETPALPLLSALHAVQQLQQMGSTTAEGSSPSSMGGRGLFARLGARNSASREQDGEGARGDVRIEVLLRELQNHLRMAEGMRLAMRQLISEEDVVANTSYNPSSPANATRIDPLKEDRWDSIETRKIENLEEFEGFYQTEGAGDSHFEESSCAICCGSLFEGDPVSLCKLPACGHYFHKDCLQEWFARASSCPICRADLNVKGAHDHDHDHADADRAPEVVVEEDYSEPTAAARSTSNSLGPPPPTNISSSLFYATSEQASSSSTVGRAEAGESGISAGAVPRPGRAATAAAAAAAPPPPRTTSSSSSATSSSANGGGSSSAASSAAGNEPETSHAEDVAPLGVQPAPPRPASGTNLGGAAGGSAGSTQAEAGSGSPVAKALPSIPRKRSIDSSASNT